MEAGRELGEIEYIIKQTERLINQQRSSTSICTRCRNVLQLEKDISSTAAARSTIESSFTTFCWQLLWEPNAASAAAWKYSSYTSRIVVGGFGFWNSMMGFLWLLLLLRRKILLLFCSLTTPGLGSQKESFLPRHQYQLPFFFQMHKVNAKTWPCSISRRCRRFITFKSSF